MIKVELLVVIIIPRIFPEINIYGIFINSISLKCYYYLKEHFQLNKDSSTKLYYIIS